MYGFTGCGLYYGPFKGEPDDSGGEVGFVPARGNPGCRAASGAEDGCFFKICCLQGLWVNGGTVYNVPFFTHRGMRTVTMRQYNKNEFEIGEFYNDF